LSLALFIAVGQGLALLGLHRLAEGGYGYWSELLFLLPAYAFTVGAPLTGYLLRTRLSARALAAAIAAVGLVLVVTAGYVGWVGGPVGELRPGNDGSVFLFGLLTVLAWFVALPFLRCGVKTGFSAEGYGAIYDEAWRLAITLAFSALFVGLFWGLLTLFVGLFASIGIDWPREIVYRRYFYYPATCAAASFAIGLTDVKPEMFRALRRLLLTVLRWLTALVAAIVLLFLGALVVEGVLPLWKTGFATAGLIALSLALVCLYNTIYQDGGDGEPLPRLLDWPVRAALALGPVLAGLAFWALALRIRQHGLSEDRLYAVLVMAILAGYLVGYSLVALLGARAPLPIRRVNVGMAIIIVVAVVAVHSPLLDLKRIAAASQSGRGGQAGESFDFDYLRFGTGRHGLLALQALARSGSEAIADRARMALAEANRGDHGPLARGQENPADKALFAARLAVYPKGRALPEDLIEHLYGVYRKDRWRLACVDQGPPCAALFIDLDGDGQDEVIAPLSGQSAVYAGRGGDWAMVGRLQPRRYAAQDDLAAALSANRLRLRPPVSYRGLEIGTDRFDFLPESCDPPDTDCPDPDR
jgi:hypothetical protein